MKASARAQGVILQMIFDAAEAGAPAPTNEAMKLACLEEGCGCQPNQALNMLVRQKRIDKLMTALAGRAAALAADKDAQQADNRTAAITARFPYKDDTLED